MKEEERVYHILGAKLLEEGAQALLSSLLGVASSSRWDVCLLTPLQDVGHVMVTAVHRFVQRCVAPSVKGKRYWSKSSVSLHFPVKAGLPVFGYWVHSAGLQEEAHSLHVSW